MANMTRSIDSLGRLVIPKELRQGLDIGENDQLEIIPQGDGILIKKFQPGCHICGGFQGIKVFKGKNICLDCQNMIKEG